MKKQLKKRNIKVFNSKQNQILLKNKKQTKKKRIIDILNMNLKELEKEDLETIIQTAHKYYESLNEVYNSYWIGKFINFFIKKGKKKLIAKKIYKAFFYFKIINSKSQTNFIFHLLEQIKPVFKLLNVYHRGIFVKYPSFVSKRKQYLVSLTWLINEIIKYKYIQNKINNITPSIINLIYEKFIDIQENQNYDLIKKRNQYIRQAILTQENMRFTKKNRIKLFHINKKSEDNFWDNWEDWKNIRKY